jgi:hypothetical protein
MRKVLPCYLLHHEYPKSGIRDEVVDLVGARGLEPPNLTDVNRAL